MIYDSKNQGDQNHKECAELNEIRPCNHVILNYGVIAPGDQGIGDSLRGAPPPLYKLGAKEVFTPQRLGGPPTGVLVVPFTA